MIKFNLITGFLGSGKTTLLGNLLQELSAKNRIAVIQNEFAPSGIDGKELKRQSNDFKLVEINYGSVFCVCQLSNFINNLLKLIKDYKPDIIFLEASGLADPISIIELLQSEELKDKVALDKSICLVDAPNFIKGLSSLVRYKHQIMVADKIILNKTDLFEGNITNIDSKLSELNHFADIIHTTYAQISWADLEVDISKKGAASKLYINKAPGGQPDIKACVLRIHDKISHQSLQSFIAELQTVCIRIKGYLNLKDGKVVSVHSVYNESEFEELKNYTGPSELIIFSTLLSIKSLREIWKKHTKI